MAPTTRRIVAKKHMRVGGQPLLIVAGAIGCIKGIQRAFQIMLVLPVNIDDPLLREYHSGHSSSDPFNIFKTGPVFFTSILPVIMAPYLMYIFGNRFLTPELWE
ncbi:hypothetical protein PF010_g25535 [Phytophthora fragariae]|uniref:Uncharacterized protein n=1 Tax=Phytophthora fragariae TaxID=53985 RepID=A0A6G0K015_9STRA|nr:hypothetical protein PF010_g25535 [Phytophthora fragariae]